MQLKANYCTGAVYIISKKMNTQKPFVFCALQKQHNQNVADQDNLF